MNTAMRFGLLKAAGISALLLSGPSLGQPVEPPLEGGAIGVFAPSQFYVVDVATDPKGNVFAIDPRYKTLSRYGPLGSLQLEIADPEFRWLRGLTVDSLGRMYVLDPTYGRIRIYASDGQFVDEWFGFLGAESMGVDTSDNIYVALGGAIEGQPEVAKYDNLGNELLRFGSFGSGPGQFNRPHDVAVAPDGSMFVTETGNSRVQKFDAAGNHLFTIGVLGDEPGEFHSPVSVSVNSSGELYVSDRRNFRMQKFDPSGNFLTMWGSKGTGLGQFLEHHGVSVGPDQTVWVAGYHGHDIQRFDPNGNLLDRWQGYVSGAGDFSDARGVAIHNGLLYAVDGWNQRVQVFDLTTGEYQFEFGERGQGAGTVFNFPRAIAGAPNGDLFVSDDDNIRHLDQNGTFIRLFPRPSGRRPGSNGLAVSVDGAALYMSSRGNNEVVKFDIATGAIIDRWGVQGSGPGQFDRPNGLAIGPDGSIYVADTHNNRVQKLTHDGQFIAEWGLAGDPVNLSGPFALALDAQESVLYVGDAWANRMVAYDLNGNPLFTWGQLGSGLGDLDNLYGVAVDSSGNVFVSERDNGRVQRFVYPYPGGVLNRPAYQPGTILGYFLWQDNDDAEWHLRWSGDGPGSQFEASITAVNGGFANVREYSFEPNGDTLIQTADSLEITAFTGTWEDGIDFFASPGVTLRFDFKINGIGDSSKVFIGETQANPASSSLYIAAQPIPPNEPATVFGSPVYQPGATNGFYVWQDSDDGRWRLRWNSDGVPRSFSGSIMATGDIVDVQTYNWEASDQYTVDGFLLNFSGRASSWDDGLSFSVPAGSDLVIRLAIDGQLSANTVFIGANQQMPSTPVFSLKSQPPQSTLDPLGQPTYVNGVDLGNFIWVDSGGTWHVRANPDGVAHEFSGQISASNPIMNFSGVSLEASDVVNVDGGVIDWTVIAGTWYDGFDFTVSPGTFLTFSLRIDGETEVLQTFIGASGQNPEGDPFLFQQE